MKWPNVFRLLAGTTALGMMSPFGGVSSLSGVGRVEELSQEFSDPELSQEALKIFEQALTFHEMGVEAENPEQMDLYFQNALESYLELTDVTLSDNQKVDLLKESSVVIENVHRLFTEWGKEGLSNKYKERLIELEQEEQDPEKISLWQRIKNKL